MTELGPQKDGAANAEFAKIIAAVGASAGMGAFALGTAMGGNGRLVSPDPEVEPKGEAGPASLDNPKK